MFEVHTLVLLTPSLLCMEWDQLMSNSQELTISGPQNQMWIKVVMLDGLTSMSHTCKQQLRAYGRDHDVSFAASHTVSLLSYYVFLNYNLKC